MPSASLNLSPSDIDDLLHHARTNALPSLSALCTSLSTSTPVPISTLFLVAVDPSSGNTVLHMAAANGHLEIISYILSHQPPPTSSGALVNITNKAGNTALHYAALNGHLEAVKVLVRTDRVETGVRNRAGFDAVEEAERGGWEGVVVWLLGVRGGVDGEGDGHGDRNGHGDGNGVEGSEEEVKGMEGLRIEGEE